jgi:threonylcarbamoyladenosine tRNA methylthiotransferase MtaB
VRTARPEAAFGADLIAGFPTETEAMFDNSLKLVDDAGLTFLHVFPFSARRGTPAARMPQVDGTLVRERAARLRARGDAALAARNAALIGSAQTLLMEKPDMGRTACFMPVRHSGEPGAFVDVRIAGTTGKQLIAA